MFRHGNVCIVQPVACPPMAGWKSRIVMRDHSCFLISYLFKDTSLNDSFKEITPSVHNIIPTLPTLAQHGYDSPLTLRCVTLPQVPKNRWYPTSPLALG